ncbi:unnamed protein product [Brassica oleracea var. botrytis]|uniref:Thionin-like protein n=1 Tax=Brassica oleracea TaxID=3712 RepID=A0A3P6DRE3_BRAOL|nr:unnamed protein product [Brassica oleracea]
MEMKTKIVFMVTMLMIGNLIVESEDINKDFQKCFTLCLNICILGPVRDKLGCFGKCGKSCGRPSEIDRGVSAQDPKKEIDVKKAKDCLYSGLDTGDKKF